MNLHKLPRAIALSLLPFLCQLPGGCAIQPTSIVLDTQSSITGAEQESADVHAVVLTELSITKSVTLSAEKPALGPQLIAGDWLAFQCALAGGYWDLKPGTGPTYAEAYEAELSQYEVGE